MGSDSKVCLLSTEGLQIFPIGSSRFLCSIPLPVSRNGLWAGPYDPRAFGRGGGLKLGLMFWPVSLVPTPTIRSWFLFPGKPSAALIREATIRPQRNPGQGSLSTCGPFWHVSPDPTPTLNLSSPWAGLPSLSFDSCIMQPF